MQACDGAFCYTVVCVMGRVLHRESHDRMKSCNSSWMVEMAWAAGYPLVGLTVGRPSQRGHRLRMVVCHLAMVLSPFRRPRERGGGCSMNHGGRLGFEARGGSRACSEFIVFLNAF